MATRSFGKRIFELWETTTADVAQRWLREPAVLGPAGSWLTALAKLKSATDQASAAWWGAMGLPTKRDQERLLHLVNELHSRVIDLEERTMVPLASAPVPAPLPADRR